MLFTDLLGGPPASRRTSFSFWKRPSFLLPNGASLSPLQLFSSMSAAFTLNFFRSGINFNKWGSFQLPGLLNFGEFKVSPDPTLTPP